MFYTSILTSSQGLSNLNYMKTKRPESHWSLTLLMGISSLFNLFLPLVLVRVLPPEQVGLYKLFFLYSMSAPWIVLASGFAKGLYFWGGHWQGNKESRFKAFSATWSFQILWSIGLLTLFALFLPFAKQLPSFLFNDSIYLALLIVGVAAAIPATFYEECRIARGENRHAGRYAATWDVIRTIVLVFSAFYFKSILAVISAFVIVTAAKMLFSSYLVIINGYAKFNFKGNAQSGAVWNYAFPLSVAAALAVLFSYGDQFVLAYYLSASEFAIYSLGCLSVPPLYIFEQMINKVMVPQLTKAMAENINSAWKMIRFAIMDLGLWLIPASFGLFFFAGPITRLLFTSQYPETENFLKIYCFFYMSFIIPYDAWERAQGKSAWVLKTTAIFAIFSLTSTWLGAKIAGAYAALGAYLFWQFALRIYSLYTMRKRLGWSIRKLLPWTFLTRSVVTSILIGILTSHLAKEQTKHFGHEALALAVWGIAYWILYIICCVPWALREERIEHNSKKVLMLTQYLNIGGLERMIYNLSNGLRSEGQWDPSVFTYDEIPGVTKLDEAFGPIQVYRQNKKPGFSFKLPFKIAKLCRQQSIDHIHAHDLGALIYAVLAKWASVGRIRVIYTLHSFVHLDRNRRHKYYERFFTSFADVITTVSGQLQTIFSEIGVAKEKVIVIENGVPFPERLETSAEKQALKRKLISESKSAFPPNAENLLWILCLARVHPGKGQLEAINIWNNLPIEAREKSLLVFVGGETQLGYFQVLQEKRDSAELSTNIILAGATLEPKPWLQTCDVLISASLQEGLPLAPLEALSLEVPVVLSQIPGHAMFSDFANMYPVNDYKAGAKVLAALLAHPAGRKKPEALLKRYSVEKMTESYIQVYTERA